MSQHKKAGSTASLKEQFKDEEISAEALATPSYDELKKQLSEAEEKASDYWDRLTRLQAETANTQRRVERDIANAHKYGIEKLILELLPIIDGLERAVEAHQNDHPDEDTEGGQGLLEGLHLTLKMLHKALEKFGIEVIDPLSQPFNPEFHQAVAMEPNGSVKQNTVLKVLQKGYVLNGRLVRPAMVVVSKAA